MAYKVSKYLPNEQWLGTPARFERWHARSRESEGTSVSRGQPSENEVLWRCSPAQPCASAQYWAPRHVSTRQTPDRQLCNIYTPGRGYTRPPSNPIPDATDRGVGLLAVLFGAFSFSSGRTWRTSVHLQPIACCPCPPHREVILLEERCVPRITPHCPKSEQRAMKRTTDFGSKDALS